MRKFYFYSLLTLVIASCKLNNPTPAEAFDSDLENPTVRTEQVQNIPGFNPTNSKNTNDNTAALPQGVWYTVTEVVDGDTFRIAKNGSKKERVRLIGIDAPETRDSQYKKVGYYGQQAKAYLKKRIENQRVLLVKDVDSLDKYGRTLSYVYLKDGSFINLDMVENGYARINTVPPNIAFAREFEQAQQRARKQKKGMWQNH